MEKTQSFRIVIKASGLYPAAEKAKSLVAENGGKFKTIVTSTGSSINFLSTKASARAGSRWMTLSQNQLNMATAKDRADNEAVIETMYNYYYGRYYAVLGSSVSRPCQPDCQPGTSICAIRLTCPLPAWYSVRTTDSLTTSCSP